MQYEDQGPVCRILPDRLGLLYFLGSTGVGKTELARALAEFFI